jgi:hypothetical protein
MYMGIKKLNKTLKEHKEEKKQQQAAISSEDPINARDRQERQERRTSSDVYQAPAGHPQVQQTPEQGTGSGQYWGGKK